METTNATRPALPPISFLDSDKLRREEVDYPKRHGELPPPSAMSSNVVNAPYPQGPPPPYTAAPQAPTITPSATPHSQTPAPDLMSKRADLKDAAKHSLPSLHEALGVERNAPYSSDAPHSATNQTAHATPQTNSPRSPRKYQVGPSPPHRPQSYGPIQPPYSQAEPTPPRAPVSEPQEFRRPEYAESYRTYQHRSPQSASSHRGSYPGPEPARSFESSQGPAPPSSQFTYGYAHTSAPYTSAAPAPASAAPIFHPSTIPHTSPEASHSWRSGPPGMPPSRPPPQAYSEFVKRHLDLYDFEMALNEIAEHSTIMHDFSRQYGARLHQTQRSGPTAGTLPAITEIDDLMNKTRHTLESLGKLREGLVAHQTAYFQQAQENLRLSQDAKRNDSVHQHDDSKSGGFAGAEPKKRRGRNAAPGRCHSCNRAETPEWRRGPDGARTLCNACGLHYAKLTRKAGANKAAIGSSSLRPKAKEENMD